MIKKCRYVLFVFFVMSFGSTSSSEQELSNTQESFGAVTDSTNTWFRAFEGADYGALFDIVLTLDGNILAVGTTNHLHRPPYSGDALFMKVTLEGDLLWEKTWGGDGYEQAIAVELAEDGGYYILGETDSHGAGDRDFFLLKIAEDGSDDWFKMYGDMRREWPYGMVSLSNGELLLHGYTESAGGGPDAYAIRVKRNGDIIWEYTVENPGEELVLDALETPEGSLVLAASVEEDGKLIELDANGSVKWVHRYELAGWQFPSQVARTYDGEYLLAGFEMKMSPKQADTWLAHCSSTGELKWETSFGDSTFDDYANSLIRLSDGTYLTGAIANGVLLTRVDEDGNIVWRRSLLERNSVYGGMALIELEDRSFLVAGLIQLVSGRSYDAFLLRADSEGNLRH